MAVRAYMVQSALDGVAMVHSTTEVVKFGPYTVEITCSIHLSTVAPTTAIIERWNSRKSK